MSGMKEADESVTVSMEIPGVDKDDIHLKVTKNSLEIKVEKRSEKKIAKKNYFRAEKSYKGFYRAMSLPCTIIPEQTKTSYRNGILEIVMQKARKKIVKAMETR